MLKWPGGVEIWPDGVETEPGGVETILSEILIESMDRLCIWSENTPSNVRTSENGWREKYRSCMNSPSTLACCKNPMVLETTVGHNFYIHSGLVAISVGLRKLLSPSFFWFGLIRWHSLLKMQKQATSISQFNQIRWSLHLKCQNGIHPCLSSIKSDGSFY